MKKLTITSFKSTYRNEPAKAGQLAARKRLFGDCSRYAVAPVHTRFDRVEWFVWDAEQMDGNLPCVIRQAATLPDALYGLTYDCTFD